MSEKLDASELIPSGAIEVEDQKDRAHVRQKDRLVTYAAIAVIGIAAVSSAIVLVVNAIWFENQSTAAAWAEEMLRLSLVSALSFVMGASAKN